MIHFVEPHEMIALVTARGFRSEPLLNTGAVEPGVPLAVGGFKLLGPRGNQHILIKDAAGRVDLDAARLWCDGVDYATAQVKAKRAWVGRR